MPKDRGAARSAAGKKKAKKRAESHSATRIPPSAAVREAVRPEEKAQGGSTATVLQFRPRAGEAGARRAGGKAGSTARTYLQPIDYSYVFTDLKIIGGLSAIIIAGLIALSFVVH